MSKNPAWNNYNEATRKANEAYEAAVKPLRKEFAENLSEIEGEFGPKIQALQAEQATRTSKARKEFQDKIDEAAATLRSALKTALDVRNAEIEAQKKAPTEKSEKVGAKAAA